MAWVVLAAAVGGVLLVAAIVIPAGAALVELFSPQAWGDAGLSERRIHLLLRGFAVALGSGALATLLGAALAVALIARVRWRAVLGAIVLSVTLVPPYVYAYSWSLVTWPSGLPTASVLAAGWSAWLSTVGRAVLCLATWLAPLAAVILALGWRVAGAAAYRLSLTDAATGQAVATGARAVWPWVLLAAGVCAALALVEFSVCHLCLVQTLNTEILAEVQQLGRPGAALALGWPLAALLLAVVLGLWPLAQRALAALDEVGGLGALAGVDTGTRSVGGSGRWVAPILAGAVLAAPLVLLVGWIRDPAAMVRTWMTYPGVWEAALTWAAGTVVGACAVALLVEVLAACSMRPGWAGWASRVALRAVWIALLAGFLAPPVLVGDAFLAAYWNVPWLADHWPIVSLVGVARFGLLPAAALHLSGRTRAAELDETARLEGAHWLRAHFAARWQIGMRGLAAGAVLCGVLAMTEVSASQMVAPGDVRNVALTLLNAIHFGRNDVVSALCLYVWLAAGLAAAAMVLLGRRRG